MKELRVSPERRFETGLIATVRLPDGSTYAQHFTGVGTQATRALAAFCDERRARVLSLSTPNTIFRDLQGSRGYVKRGTGSAGDSWFYAAPPENAVALPENDMLARIGRRDLL